jgi:hypothetical protein
MAKQNNPKPNDQRSNTKNPNHPDQKSATDNRSNQKNPNHTPTNPPKSNEGAKTDSKNTNKKS